VRTFHPERPTLAGLRRVCSSRVSSAYGLKGCSLQQARARRGVVPAARRRPWRLSACAAGSAPRKANPKSGPEGRQASGWRVGCRVRSDARALKQARRTRGAAASAKGRELRRRRAPPRFGACTRACGVGSARSAGDHQQPPARAAAVKQCPATGSASEAEEGFSGERAPGSGG
jgi:hypothetical protein